MASGAAGRVTPRVLAVLLIGVLASQWMLLRTAVTNPPWSSVGFMPLLFVTLTVLSVVGLLRVREWGFYSAYLLVPFSTVFHGVALVPFVTDALPSLQGAETKCGLGPYGEASMSGSSLPTEGS